MPRKVLVIFILICAIQACTMDANKGLALYVTCTQGVTKNTLLIPVKLPDNAPTKLNACVDEESVLKINEVSEIKVHFFELKGNRFTNLKVNLEEAKKISDDVKIFALINIHLDGKVQETYSGWGEERQAFDEIVVTINGYAISTNRLGREAKVHESIVELKVGEDLLLVEELISELSKLKKL